MARFEYVTQNAKGAPFVRAFADASSLADLNTRLQNLNKPVIEIIDLPGKDSPRKASRISLRTKLTFLEQLEASSYLGMDFRTSLGICLRTTSGRTRQGRQMIRVISDLREKVSGGLSFARAIKSYPNIFDPVAVGLISAGEEGGTFSEALTNVRKIWTRDEDLQHRLLMLLIYPAIVLASAIGVVWLLVTRVVPQFIHVLGEMNLTLPLPTRILLGLSHFVSAYPLVPLLASAAGFLLFLELPSFVRATPVLHGVALRLPGIGRLLRLLLQANFCRTFAQLKHAKARTTQTLILCRDLSWNYQYRSAVARVLVRVQQGEQLSSALLNEIDIFGEHIVNGLSFMEASGSDSEGMFRLTTLLERQLDSYLGALRQILDPVLILFLGVIVGGIVFATFLPAIEIMGNI